MLRNAIKHKVKIALGTDQFPFEPNDATTATIREAQVLRRGRHDAARRRSVRRPSRRRRMLGMQDRLGSIEPGKLADVDHHRRGSLEGHPRRFASIKLVMKGGVVYRNELAR